MITVRYDKPKRLASVQSIFVSFPYKQAIVDAIREVPERYWDGKNKMWELPHDALSLLQKRLNKEEFNITGQPINNKVYGEKLLEKTYEVPVGIKTKMFQHQIDGYNELLNFNKYLLLDSQGVGKSITSLAVALKRKEINDVHHCLIVCGVNGLKYNWQNEIKQHTGLDSMILGNRKNKKGVWSTGSNTDKLEDLDNLKEFFIITNVESLRDKSIRDKLKTLFDKKIIEMCVLDEIHKCFAYDTKVYTSEGWLKIGDIVTHKMDVLVASYNENAREVKFSEITNYFENVPTEKKIKLTFSQKLSIQEIVCTENHLFYTKNRGWIKAKDLRKTDKFTDLIYFYSYTLLDKEYLDDDFSLMYDLEIEGNHNYFAEGCLVHNCKSPSSQQGKALLLLAKHIKYFYGLTGTIIKNNPLDMYVPLKCVDKEPANFTQFKSRYCEFGGFGGYQIIGYKHLDELQHKLESVSLRRTKEEVLDLPPKIYIDDYVEMGVKQKRIYKAVLKAVLEDLDNISLSLDPLAQLIRLRQATADTSILSSTVSESAKIERLKDIIEECVSNNQKIIIFSNWTKVTNIVYNKLKEYNPALITGEIKDREKEKDKFMTDPTCKVIIGTIGAMGTGYTLTEATTAVFLDEPYTWADKEQAADRIHRIGTKSSVNIITLLCKDTVDEYIHRLINKKRVLGDAIVDKRYNLKNKDVLKFILTGEGEIG